jgi:hypothetical protein
MAAQTINAARARAASMSKLTAKNPIKELWTKYLEIKEDGA